MRNKNGGDTKRRSILGLAALLLSAIALAVWPGCTGANVTSQDIQGLLQSIEGKEAIVTLGDGSTVRITVQDAQQVAQQLVGKEVRVRVKVNDRGERELEDVRGLGEDQTITGVIESMSANSWVIGGKTFKVDANTFLDGGLAVGVTARVEFITLSDGSMLAREIETDADGDHFKGTVQTIGTDAWVVGGKTFKVNAATRIDAGLVVGAAVRVEFTQLPDQSALAVKIESDKEDRRSSGTVESVSASSWVIGGKTFKVNTATRIDPGLAVGVRASVKFLRLADNSMLATNIEIDQTEDRLNGSVESVSPDKWVVGGKTFKVNTATRLDRDLAVGLKARVRFVTLADGSMLATRVQLDKSGPGRGTSGRDERGDSRGPSGDRGQSDNRSREAEDRRGRGN